MAVHVVRLKSEPVPGPPSPLRITAAIARIVRAHAQALDDLASVFGHDSDVASVLAARVDALTNAGDDEQRGRAASNLHCLAVWLAAAAETIETDSAAAADLRPYLAQIITECEMVAEMKRAA